MDEFELNLTPNFISQISFFILSSPFYAAFVYCKPFLFESYAAVLQFSLIPIMNSPVRCVIILQGYPPPSPFVDLSINNRSVLLLIIITTVFLNSNAQTILKHPYD